MFTDPASTVAHQVGTDAEGTSSRLRTRACETSGFSLIELLVVILIIGVLAAIAIPSFLSNKGRAIDVQAKELVRTAETTAEAIASANDGNYEKVTRTELQREEPSISFTKSQTAAYVSSVTSSRSEYSITATATNGDEFTITKNSSGTITRGCASPVTKKGCDGSASSTW